jgi:hypothetical protein
MDANRCLSLAEGKLQDYSSAQNVLTLDGEKIPIDQEVAGHITVN